MTPPLHAPRALLLSVLVLGCTSAPQQAQPEAPETPQTGAAVAPSAAAPLSPDAILQDRLRAAVRDLDARRASRRARVSGLFLIGLAPPGTPPAGGGAPSLRMGATSVAGRVPPELIQRVVRQNFGMFRLCYETGLRKDPKLGGRISTSFTIDAKGAVKNVSATSDLPDKDVVECVKKDFAGLVFPALDAGVVKVTYPITFTPADPAPAPPASASAPPSPPSSPPPASAPLSPPSSPPPASAAPSPPAPPANPGSPAPLASPDPAGPWSIVAIEGDRVLVDGTPAGDLAPILAEKRLRKVDGLFDTLKKARESWKAAHPGTSFPGVAGLRAAPDTPLFVFHSVFQTMAFAGYPDILVQSATEPAAIFELDAQVPGPPDPAAALAPAPAEPPPWPTLRAEGTESVLVWKKGATVISEERAPLGAEGLTEKLCNGWKARNPASDPADARSDEIVLGGGHGQPLSALIPLIRAVEGCTREQRLPGGETRKIPVFWITLSVH